MATPFTTSVRLPLQARSRSMFWASPTRAGRSGTRSASVLASSTRMLALLNSRDDPVGEVCNSPAGGLRIIWICCAAAFAPCTKGSVSGCTPMEFLFPIMKLKVTVDVCVQAGIAVWTPAGGTPPLQLADGIVNFRQLALPVGLGGSQSLLAKGIYTSPGEA